PLFFHCSPYTPALPSFPTRRSSDLCALLLQTIAGFDPLDPCTVPRDVPDYTAALTGSVRGLRIGIPREYFFDSPELPTEIGDAEIGRASCRERVEMWGGGG